MSIHESKRHVVLTSSPAGDRKIFSVSFDKRDGSIFVHLPYHTSHEGILGVAGGVKIDQGRFAYDSFIPIAKTNHYLKFSYHPDGRTHFSQTGKIITSLVRHVEPLADNRGPIFYVKALGLSGFQLLMEAERRASETKKALFAAHFDEDVSGVSFTGFLKPRSEMQPRDGSTLSEPFGNIVLPNGHYLPALAIGSPYHMKHHDRVLAITVEAFHKRKNEPITSTLIFCGPIRADSDDDPRKSCQAVLYPRSIGGTDLESVSSIDIATDKVSAIGGEIRIKP